MFSAREDKATEESLGGQNTSKLARYFSFHLPRGVCAVCAPCYEGRRDSHPRSTPNLDRKDLSRRP